MFYGYLMRALVAPPTACCHFRDVHVFLVRHETKHAEDGEAGVHTSGTVDEWDECSVSGK